MQSFLDTLAQKKGLPVELALMWRQSIVQKSVTKGQILLHKNEVSARSYFVQSGCLRSYSIDAKGKEHIFMFAPEGWTIGNMQSQTSQTPSDLFIDALEDKELEVFNEQILDKMALQKPEMMRNGFEKLLRRNAVLQKRVIMFMSATAWERYQHFIQTYPNIVQRVPQRLVASYLGITREALSKMRGDMARQKTI